MISEKKKEIVVGNCFNIDCNIDTTIREAYELGFDRGMQKVDQIIRRVVLKQVLEIIDKVGNRAEAGDMDAYEVYTEIRYGVLALKGGAD